MALVIAFNILFWAIMIVPAYVLTFAWGFRMLYYWSCGRKLVTKTKVLKRRISKMYDQ